MRFWVRQRGQGGRGRLRRGPPFPRPARPTPPAVNAKGLPIGTRVLGLVTHELRARQLMKVLSLAARVF